MTIHELAQMQHQAALAGPVQVESRIDQLEMLRKAIVKWESPITQALSSDLGKSREEAYMTEIAPVVQEISFIMRNLAAWAKPRRVKTPRHLLPARSYILKEPLGSLLIVSPWHYPFHLSLIPLVGALAAGNRCIVKPSQDAPATARIVAQLISECFPVEQAAVVLGGRAEMDALLEEKFDLIFFSGGFRAGRAVMEQAARTLTPVILQLGGKSPCIVDDSANIPSAARRIAWGKALGAGQSSVAPDYLLVHYKVQDRLLSAIRDCWDAFYGNALNSPQWPPVGNERQYQRLMSLMAGEQVFCGGVGDGARIAPTILTNVSWNAPIMQEEIFGPVLPVIPFDRLRDVIPILKSRGKAPALYLFSSHASVQDEVLTQVPFGGGCVNDTLLHSFNSALPFGGIGDSGMGQYHGRYSFNAFTHEKGVVVKGKFGDMAFRYPPFTREKTEKIQRIMR